MMGSVALVDGDTVIAEQMLNTKITHSERLIPSIKAILETAGVKLAEIDAFAASIGPGSFTGLRVGLAAAKGFAYALKKPIVGISSLKSLAYNMYGCELVVVSLIDARRGEYYISAGRFKGCRLNVILDDTVMPPEDVIRFVKSLKEKAVFVGDGTLHLKDALKKGLGVRAVIPPAGKIHPHASNIAMLAVERLKKGDADDVAALAPNYVRKSDAEKE